MVLFTWKKRPSPKPGVYAETRWTFQINWGQIGAVNQYRFSADQPWADNHAAVCEVNITKYWRWGSGHGYYDGPHCSFSVGFVHFCWSNWNCKVCCPKPKGEA